MLALLRIEVGEISLGDSHPGAFWAMHLLSHSQCSLKERLALSQVAPLKEQKAEIVQEITY